MNDPGILAAVLGLTCTMPARAAEGAFLARLDDTTSATATCRTIGSMRNARLRPRGTIMPDGDCLATLSP